MINNNNGYKNVEEYLGLICQLENSLETPEGYKYAQSVKSSNKDKQFIYDIISKIKMSYEDNLEESFYKTNGIHIVDRGLISRILEKEHPKEYQYILQDRNYKSIGTRYFNIPRRHHKWLYECSDVVFYDLDYELEDKTTWEKWEEREDDTVIASMFELNINIGSHYINSNKGYQSTVIPAGITEMFKKGSLQYAKYSKSKMLTKIRKAKGVQDNKLISGLPRPLLRK